MTPKENFRKFFQHERGEWFPSFFTDANLSVFITGLDERAPHNQSGKDFFGCTWVYDPVGNAAVPDTSVLPVLDDICDWREKVVFPDLDAVDWEASAKADKVDQYDPDKFNYSMLLEGPFERLHTLMGFENALCSMLTDPEEVEAFLDAMVEFKCAQLTKIRDYYRPDVLNFHDDYGTQRGLFFSPDIWRDMFKPRLKKIVDHCHGLGMIFELHSCGLIEDIIPDICEIGADCLQCMDINDVRKMKEITGDQMAYGVSPNFQRYAAGMAVGTMGEKELRKEIHEEIMTLSEGGNYYPFINPPFTEMDRIIWEEAEVCRQELLKLHGVLD